MEENRIYLLNLLQNGEDIVKVRCIFFVPDDYKKQFEEIEVPTEELFKFTPHNGNYTITDGYANGYLFIGVFNESADVVIEDREPFIIIQENGTFKAYNAEKSSSIKNPYVLTQIEKNSLIKKLYR